MEAAAEVEDVAEVPADPRGVVQPLPPVQLSGLDDLPRELAYELALAQHPFRKAAEALRAAAGRSVIATPLSTKGYLVL